MRHTVTGKKGLGNMLNHLNNVAEAGDQLNCSRTKIFELIRLGRMKTVKLGKERMIPQSEIDKLVDQEMASR